MKQRMMRVWFWAVAALFLVGVVAAGDGSGGAPPALVDLHEENWQLMLNGEWMVEFFAPWCPACKNLATTWERYATGAQAHHVKIAKIDVTTSPSLSGRFFVTALPTIYHVKNGEFRQYRGARDYDALMYYIKQRQWEKVEPISAWKKPDTIHMSILSYFFKLSHTLKDFNGRLQEEYGLPTWGSYALFAIGTIFVGAALGLILVCIVDFLYPPKKSQRQSFSEAREKSLRNSVEDLDANDEIEDDAAPQQEDNDEDDDDEEAADDDDEDDDDEEEEDDDDEEENEDADEAYEEQDGAKHITKETKHKTETAEEGNEKKTTSASASPAEVRKRKPRKAD